VVIDPHYEENHAEGINDDLILKLVALLDGIGYESNDLDPPFEYHVSDGLILNQI
jgi:hypothetical protein